MTTKDLPDLSNKADGYKNANGETIPESAFENDFEARPMPLTPEQRAAFDAKTEALRKFKR